MNLPERVRVIDIFAGPGGLGEGFSALSDAAVRFEIALSVEKDVHAHRTLLLRSFFRKFERGAVPEEYYCYVRGETGTLEDLLRLFPEEAALAREEARHAELGGPDGSDDLIDRLISQAIGNVNDWVLVGGPPCQAYSVMGRSRRINADPDGFRKDARHRLYEHYLRILARHGPSVFVMENVKGLLSSPLESEKLLSTLLPDLERPCEAVDRKVWKTGSAPPVKGYRIYSISHPARAHDLFELSTGLVPEDLIVESERHGIPQRRHRVFIIGVRVDRTGRPPDLLSGGEGVNVGDVIDDLPRIRSILSREVDSPGNWREAIEAEFCRCTFDREAASILEAGLARLEAHLPVGSRFVPGQPAPRAHGNWYVDRRLGGVLNHEARPHRRDDLLRYLYLACMAERTGSSIKLRDFPECLLPSHASATKAVAHRHGYFNDRFRVQLAGSPATTITSHISKDGHYYIHPDPGQCRSLTVREAARLQTFPDNYFFEGPRTQQYIQVGNAVPPLLATQIARVIGGVLSDGVVSRPIDVSRETSPDWQVAGG